MHGKAAAVPASEAVIVARPTSASVDWPASLQSLLATVVIATFVITFVVQAFQIPSESMENTLLIGDYLLVDKFCYGEAGIWGALMPYRKIQRGDVVVFHYPVRPSQHFVKRVVGIPGDRVRMRRCATFSGMIFRAWIFRPLDWRRAGGCRCEN
ncbi:MAG: signal peptidase I [Acidobacteria bacterium]|nr:MAG: signal peptidase I [Acidobacteriota bacterium]